jgi:DNA-binding transcriptional regulator GbsR (MarR family)
MINKKSLTRDHLFEGKIKEYEDILIQFVMDVGRAKSVEPNLQLILGYIGIHKKLTQKQLKDLTNLSSGTISKKLRDIIALGIIIKERIPKSNENLYIIAPEFYGDAADTTLDEINKMIDYLKKIRIEIEKNSKKKGAEFLSERIENLVATFKTTQNIWSDIEFIFKQNNK